MVGYRDLKLVLRRLARNPGYSVVVVAVLALGIGANTAIFSLFNSILLKPLPGREPDKLVTVYTSDYSGPLYGTSSYPDFEDFVRDNTTLSGLAAYTLEPFVLSTGDSGHRVLAGLATPSFFQVLDLEPGQGRFFGTGEDLSESPPAVISHSAAKRFWEPDAILLGRPIRLNGHSFVISGVAPEGFVGPNRASPVDIWVPLETMRRVTAETESLTSRGHRDLELIGRLAPNVDVSQAADQFAAIARRQFENYPDRWENRLGEPRSITVLPESQSRVPPDSRGLISAFLSVLLAFVGLVMLIACADVANLQLVKAIGRRREMAVRLVVGASRWALVKQSLLESLLPALLAGGIGLALGTAVSRLLLSWKIPFASGLDLRLDYRVVTFTFGVSLLAALLFGVAPAIRASSLRQIGALRGSEESGGHRLRKGLVVAQVSLCLVLLVAAGLFLRGLGRAQAIELGFDSRDASIFSIDSAAAGYNEDQARVFYRQLQESIETLPGVESAALVWRLPLTGIARRSVRIEDYQPGQGEDMEIPFTAVGPGYFRTLNTPLVRGRAFGPEDEARTQPVVIVNESFVRRYWPGESGLGKRVTVQRRVEGRVQPYEMEVVGVARDGKYRSLGESSTPFLFYPLRQHHFSSVTAVLRTGGSMEGLASSVRAAIASIDPKMTPYNFSTLEAQLDVALLPIRLASLLVGVMGMVALVLATLGLYGVVAYVVGGRMLEFGIRMALGAEPSRILKLVLRQGLVLSVVGTILGLGVSALVTRLLGFLLYGVSPLDPLTFAAVTGLLLAVCVAATLIPARRAAKADTAQLLRTS